MATESKANEVRARLSATLTYTGFSAFAQSQPQAGTFAYVSNDHCAISQFLKEEGFQDVSTNPVRVTVAVDHLDHVTHKIPSRIGRAMDAMLDDTKRTTPRAKGQYGRFLYTWGELASALRQST